MTTAPTQPKVVMSGMRPTGRLHLGHYFGVLKNWVTLQNQYQCFYMIADWHALTTKVDDTKDLETHILEIAMDWLAAGLDPTQCAMYVQSTIPEIAELHLLLSMLTPVKWVETDPTLKDMVQMSKEELSYGLLGYPILQTADILAAMGELVPVGKDQVAHLEISRDIARRFNHMFGETVFAEPRPLLTEVPMLVGLDGRKMGKSYGNAIFLADSEDETAKKVKTAITDPARLKRDDPGNPLACEAVFPYYQVFANAETIATTDTECRQAQRGCVDCKKQLAELINESLRPLRERRKVFAEDPAQVQQILKAGTEHMRSVSTETLKRVRRVMHMIPANINDWSTTP